MIFGVLTLSGGGDPSVAAEHVLQNTGSEGLVFHRVIQGSFSGGYFLHAGLPYISSDLYFTNQAADISVLLSGSVYNSRQLCEQHGIAGPVAYPELIARLFLKEGPEFIGKLNGDFTVFISRNTARQAYLFRDHVGIRPMAWSSDGVTLYFSSDINGLCRALSDNGPANSEYLLGYFKYPDYRNTPDKKVKKLLPGHYLRFTERKISVRKYWDPASIKVDNNLSHERMMADLKSLVSDAVMIRCDERFTAGAHVSSGIDSGIVSVLACSYYKNQADFYGFSWSPDEYRAEDADHDERNIIASACKKSGIKPVFSDLSPEEFPQVVSSYYHNQGFFSEDRVVRQAGERKTNLLFSGWGGDEFISTGDRGIEQDLLRRLKLGIFLRRSRIRQPRKFIKDQLTYVINPALGILGRTIAKSFRDDARYIKRPYRKSDRKTLGNFYFHTSRRQLHLRLLDFYHIQNRCEAWFIMGYRRGLEYRYPLLDKRIIEYMLKVPSELLCKSDSFRPLLRAIGEGIMPEEVRMNWHKNDPVYWEWMDGLFRDAAIRFMEEVPEWQHNPDLHFVDFELLHRDIADFRDYLSGADNKVLFRALVYLKAIHAFLSRYRIND